MPDTYPTPSLPTSLADTLATLGQSPTATAIRRVIRHVKEANLRPTGTPLRLAVLSSFNVDLLAVHLELECLRFGRAAELYTAPYGQFRQELLGGDSTGLAAFRADFTFLLLEPDAVFGRLIESPLSVPDAERDTLRRAGLAELDRLVSPFVDTGVAVPADPKSSTHSLSGRLVLNTLAAPAVSPLGLLDPVHPASLRRLLATANDHVCELAARHAPRVLVFDFDSWLADRGRGRRADARMVRLTRRLLADELLAPLAADWARLLRGALGLTRKLLVLDCDNTLWGGVVGEDGPTGVQLGPDAPGNAFCDFQREVRHLMDRGVPVAVCSKNNPDDARAVLAGHPHMLIAEHEWAALRINWADKADNLRSIAEEVGLGLDSLVFLDDSPYERASVRAQLPMVLVPELPAEPADRPDFLRRLGVFDSPSLTREDAGRAAMYAVRRQRAELAETAARRGRPQDFLTEMQMRVGLANADKFTVPRVAQLVARTNQFNLTARRHSPEAIAALSASPSWWVLTLSLTDRLGDHGLVGAALIERGEAADPAAWRLDTVVISCRVLGWGVETALLAHITQIAIAEGAARVVGEFRPTDKNKPAADFYPRHGFRPHADSRADLYRYVWCPTAGDPAVEVPSHLAIIVEPAR